MGATTAKSMSINKAHAMLGHMGQEDVRAICKHYNLHLVKRGFQLCSHCGKAKAKQAAVLQHNEEHTVAGLEGQQFFIDTSSVKHGSCGRANASKILLLSGIKEANLGCCLPILQRVA